MERKQNVELVLAKICYALAAGDTFAIAEIKSESDNRRKVLFIKNFSCDIENIKATSLDSFSIEAVNDRGAHYFVDLWDIDSIIATG